MPLPKEQNSKEMDSAIQAFKDWRSNREKMCRIPDRLWKIAAKLSPQYPISTICENLGLNWGTLKKKINHFSLSAHANHAVKAQKQLSFVELKLNNQEQPPSLLLNQSTSPHCAIELTRPDGTVMKIFSSSPDNAPLNLDILKLCKTFLGSHGSQQ
ncbi:MAG: hypothetical protein GTN53_30680 [Candidatus Aminicenantes bacterium]|nr:hypothetical protein [Candidatus Aminicenantes bacterium]NIQ70829.1 hypothetical protein [Candidatus Aminicenantes bacterium]NIT26875.1 hypothetical protein [Candidatus Aminicenantes bacterium]